MSFLLRTQCLHGDFLCLQIIYAGKIHGASLPLNFLVVGYTENHWSNKKTTEDYIKLVLLPYLQKKRSLESRHPALVIFDRFKAQCTKKLLDKNNIRLSVVPDTTATGSTNPLKNTYIGNFRSGTLIKEVWKV